MASKKTSKKLRKGQKMGSVKPLDIVITKSTDQPSPGLMK